MNKRLLVLSMVVLSNGLCAMESSDDWEDVGSNASQLMQDLVAIQEEKDREMQHWEDLDPMATKIHESIIVNENYPDQAPIKAVIAPSPSTIPAPSPKAHSTSLTSASASSTNSHISDASTDDASSIRAASRMQSSSPIGAVHYSVPSLHALASSIISDESIETSAREDRGAHCNDRLDDDDDLVHSQQKKKKRRLPKNKIKQELVEDLGLEVFALEIFKYILGLHQPNE